MNTLDLTLLINLESTLLGGQSFNWEFHNGYFYGVYRDNLIKIKQEKTILHWQTYPTQNNSELINNYFRLNFEYENMLKSISKDQHILNAIDKHSGLRLLSQDLFETIVSFIISQNKNITSIRKSISLLRENFGRKISDDNKEFYLFPSLENLKNITLDDLAILKIGYRDKYVLSAIEFLLKTKLLDHYQNLNHIEVKNELLKIKGIGNKVADCIITFSGISDVVTPIDTWGIKIATELYNLPSNYKYEEMSNWFSDYFGEYTSWAGQFLFEYIRNKKD